ncbi:olfactory receptor 5AC2-like [Pelobates fuscus]|uniref:olfactory receptor 5AC2-like n=1 Tax=Pelobates fuscus TaxID=191477 RepID=UPI002FE4B132
MPYLWPRFRPATPFNVCAKFLYQSEPDRESQEAWNWYDGRPNWPLGKCRWTPMAMGRQERSEDLPCQPLQELWKMENTTTSPSFFILIGLREMEAFKYLYFVVGLGIYVTTMLLCPLLSFTIWTEPSLHEPMYIFICNLIINANCMSTAFLPKLMNDLLTDSELISYNGCLVQAFAIQSFACVDIFMFTIMAYDRYLAIGNPLRYTTLMTNKKALQVTGVIWVFSLIFESVPVVRIMMLSMCGFEISNVYCETMSLYKLVCGDAFATMLWGTTMTLFLILPSFLIIIYSYIKTFLICMKISKQASQKAINTLATHIIAFSIFMIGSLFIVFRYKINGGPVSSSVQLVLALAAGIVCMAVRDDNVETFVQHRTIDGRISEWMDE